MARFGGPRWIPRGGVPIIRRRRRRTAWVMNGDTSGTVSTETSSAQVDKTANNEGQNQFTPVVLLNNGYSTRFLGFLLTTFDDKSVEDADQQSVNQVDALSGNLALLRIQGFIQLRQAFQATEGFSSPPIMAGFMICHQQSDSFDDVDQLDYVDPSLWRSNRMIHSEMTFLSTLTHVAGTSSILKTEHQSMRNLNLRVRRRLRKNEVISLWVYHDQGVPTQDAPQLIVNWAMRCLISR